MLWLVASLALALAALYLYGTRNFDYWARRGVKHARPLPFLGTDAERYLLRRSVTQMAADAYRRHPDERFVGYFRGNTPELVLRDPELIKRVLVTDFAHFHARGLSPAHGRAEPLLRNLFFADGDLWRLLRQRLTPAFSSGRLRAMFPLVAARASRLRRRLRALLAAGPAETDARDLMARYTTDFIGAVGFGLDPEALDDDDSEFRKLGARIFEMTGRRAITALLKTLFPTPFRSLKFLGQELEDDVLGLVRQILRQRDDRVSGRDDFVDLLIELRDRGEIEAESLERLGPDGEPARVRLRLDDELLAAQAFIFFAAGFETSSSATSFTLHQLAFHPEAQRRAREEVDRALATHGGRLSWDCVADMEFLERCFLEAMRLFPSSGFLLRRCERRYTLPGTEVTLEPGVRVVVPVQALHTDPVHFPEPASFRPERFEAAEAAARHRFVYLPFGGGPRACVGGRLGRMQSLAGLAAVLATSRVEPAASSARALPVDPRPVIVQAVAGGVPLRFVARDDAPRWADGG